MQKYAALKIVEAEPLVKDGKEGFRVVCEDGYGSWCPADVFLKHKRETEGLPFSIALEALKRGAKIQRKGWNGKGMYLFLQKGSVIRLEDGRNPALREMTGDITILPHIDMKSAGGGIVIGWLASQTDMLSEDWVIL